MAKMTVEVTDELPPGLIDDLATLGIKPPAHAPVARPKPRRTMESQGWHSSYSGEDSPF